MRVCQKLQPRLPTLFKLWNARLLILTTAVLSYLEKADQQTQKNFDRIRSHLRAANRPRGHGPLLVAYSWQLQFTSQPEDITCSQSSTTSYCRCTSALVLDLLCSPKV
jgi:hypothetical protein